MESEEVDAALEELETRLERLRALYEQYFLGIEKLEPQIPRKDVDRRIYVLRREKIRNTGKRFKLQTLISRYNTFQQYWQRICREIENGTYKRHLLRAEKTVGPGQLLTAAARRRFGRERALRESQAPAPDTKANEAAPAAGSDSPPAAASSAPAPAPAASVRPRSRTPTWPGIPTPPPPSAGPAPAPFLPAAAATPAGVQPPEPAARLAAAPAQQVQPASSVPAGRPAPSSSPRRQQQFESLELDMDFMGDWDPETAAKGRLGARAPSPAEREPASPPVREAKAAIPDAQRKALAAQRAARERAAEKLTELAEPKAAPERPPAEQATAARAPEVGAGGASAKASVAPRRLAPPPKPKREPTPEPRSVAPSVPPPQPAERRSARPPTERPPAPKPADPATVAARARAARQKAAEPVSDGKLRELHQRLAEVSKGAGQPTVSFDGLSKSLRAAEAKLRQKHGNRRIDFEVVLKDGKPVVKPIVR